VDKLNALIDRARIHFIELMSVADVKPWQSQIRSDSRDGHPEEPNEPSGSQLILTDPVSANVGA